VRLRVQSETPRSREDIEGVIKLGATVGLFRPGTGIVYGNADWKLNDATRSRLCRIPLRLSQSQNQHSPGPLNSWQVGP
jgi:hypothetical protein